MAVDENSNAQPSREPAGSFNRTTAAIKHNAKNALVLWNVPQVAKVYAREWARLWEESR
jgi:hypothetical protein